MARYTPDIEEIYVYEGDDTSMDFTSKLGDITGYTIKLQARITMGSRYAILDVSGVVTSGSTGGYTIVFPSLETLGKGNTKPYYYDIKLTAPDGKVHTDRQGELIIEPRTTELLNQSTIADNESIKDALQSLETAVESASVIYTNNRKTLTGRTNSAGVWTTITHNLNESRLASVSFFDEANNYQNLNSAVLWRPKAGDANSIEVYHSQAKTMTVVLRV